MICANGRSFYESIHVSKYVFCYLGKVECADCHFSCSLRALEFHFQPQVYIQVGKQCSDRHAQGRGVLLRVHPADNMVYEICYGYS